ncbi:MAG: flavodoxin-dependent (E)-4-hydroxy-3-methylbut-2-enyl-diphosphate synthase [Candidatus Omnitrophota bacterium]|jgi:(E)-4-hydroxy-3-methylbut-2-enyl-diphosphate synthase
MIKRRKTRTVKVGNVRIGYGHPISIQSMTKTDTSDIESTVRQIHELENAGCEIIRVAVKDPEDAKAVRQIKEEIAIPLVADIHFDYRLAIESIKSGADKIRINPGNIHKFDDIDKIIDEAFSSKVPIRIGVNSGSLKESQRASGDIADRMVSFALKYIDHFEKRNFNDLVISLKASEVPATVKAYRKIAEKCDYPLHLGITAAGLPDDGIVKSSIGLGMLIMNGIGDTVRVSLTGNPVFEVDAAKRILAFVGARHLGPQIIACPTCGRCQVDLVPIVEELEDELKGALKRKAAKEEKQLLIAVMGCEVNGPGEAKDADIGVAFGKDKGVIFSHGKAVKTIKAGSAIKELLKIIKKEI